jgi:4-hydroxy-tetrahydrodipicolinate reductase
MEQIKVVVYGASGRVGQEVVKAVCRDPETALAGVVDLKAGTDTLALPDGSGNVPFSSDLDSILKACKPDVIVDFTASGGTMPAVHTCAERGVHMVIGATGHSADDIKDMENLSLTRGIGIVLAPNFALGAVLMMHLAKIAGKYFDHAEIIELHHDRKVDAPSGTSKMTARNMLEARGKPFEPPAVPGEDSPSRGRSFDGINIHSVRLPGYMAHQEVILGGDGQTLHIRHDQISREAFMPGVLLAIKEIVKNPRFIYGLDNLLGL